MSIFCSTLFFPDNACLCSSPQRHDALQHPVETRAIWSYGIPTKVQEWKKQNSWNARQIFFWGNKPQSNKCGRRILLGDNTGGGALMLRPIRLQRPVNWTSAGRFWIYTEFWPHECSFPSCAMLELSRNVIRASVTNNALKYSTYGALLQTKTPFIYHSLTN
jgi:hypothetical protein